jgi:polyhydroxyalkanoate synthase
MNELFELALEKGLELNERVAASVINGLDWVFRHDELVLSGRTSYDVVHQGDLMAVRYYDLADEKEIKLADGSALPVQRRKQLIPLVLVPPLGATTDSFDLMPNRSMVRYFAARGFKTYLIDWGKPERRHAHFGIKDYAEDMMTEALAKVREHSGVEQVSLMGWCMGGLLSLMYAGLKTDPRVVNIVTLASPIDLRSGGVAMMAAARLDAPARLIRKYTFLDRLLESVDPAKLHTSGRMTTLLFKLMSPVASVTTYWDLLTRLSDRKFVEAHSTTKKQLDNMLLYPGGVLKEMLLGAVMDNALFKGRIKVGNKITRFSNISASMLVFAGETDGLVKVPTAQRLIELMPTEDKVFVTAPGGHMGVVIGTKAQKEVWGRTADWLADGRSGGITSARAAKKSRRVATGKTVVVQPRSTAASKKASAKPLRTVAVKKVSAKTRRKATSAVAANS